MTIHSCDAAVSYQTKSAESVLPHPGNKRTPKGPKHVLSKPKTVFSFCQNSSFWICGASSPEQKKHLWPLFLVAPLSSSCLYIHGRTPYPPQFFFTLNIFFTSKKIFSLSHFWMFHAILSAQRKFFTPNFSGWSKARDTMLPSILVSCSAKGSLSSFRQQFLQLRLSFVQTSQLTFRSDAPW